MVGVCAPGRGRGDASLPYRASRASGERRGWLQGAQQANAPSEAGAAIAASGMLALCRQTQPDVESEAVRGRTRQASRRVVGQGQGRETDRG